MLAERDTRLKWPWEIVQQHNEQMVCYTQTIQETADQVQKEEEGEKAVSRIRSLREKEDTEGNASDPEPGGWCFRYANCEVSEDYEEKSQVLCRGTLQTCDANYSLYTDHNSR